MAPDEQACLSLGVVAAGDAVLQQKELRADVVGRVQGNEERIVHVGLDRPQDEFLRDGCIDDGRLAPAECVLDQAQKLFGYIPR